MEEPLVSIIIPTFNRAHMIGQTLDSVRNQSYMNWECIVVDDSSFDYTEELMHFYVEKDRRIHFCRRPKKRAKGANTCRNYGFELSRGRFVKWFDSDDLLFRDSLQVQVNHLLNEQKLDASIGYAQHFKDVREQNWQAKPAKMDSNDVLYDYIKGDLFFITGGPLWRKEFLDKQQKLFREDIFKYQDSEFHYRMLLEDMKFGFLEKPVLEYRDRGVDSITRNSEDRSLQSMALYWEQVMKTAHCANKAHQKEVRLFAGDNLSRLFYRLIINRKSILSRIKWTTEHYNHFIQYINELPVSFVFLVKLHVGILTTIFTGKGLKLFRIRNYE